MYNILTQCIRVMPDSLQPRGLYSPWNSPGQNTEVGSFSLLQVIFPTQGSNSDLLHCRQILYQLSHKGSPSVQQRTPNSLPRKACRHWFQILIICVLSRDWWLVIFDWMTFILRYDPADMTFTTQSVFPVIYSVKGHILLFSLCK